MSVSDELRRVADLHAAGHLSEEEFAAAKRRILSDASPDAPTPVESNHSTTPADAVDQQVGHRDTVAGGSRWRRLSPTARAAVAAAGTMAVIAVTATSVAVLTRGEEPSGSQARPAADPTTESPTPEVPVETFKAPEPTEEVYSDSVTLAESGWTPVAGGSLASWGAVLDNPTSTFAYVTVSVEQLNRRGAILTSDSVGVTVEPRIEAPIGGMVPLERDAKDAAISVTLNNYDEEDGEFFVTSHFDLTGRIVGRETNTDLTLTASSAVLLKSTCTMYLLFRDKDHQVVGGATLEDHPPIPAGGRKTFKKYLIDDIVVPSTAQDVSGYGDTSSCM